MGMRRTLPVLVSMVLLLVGLTAFLAYAHTDPEPSFSSRGIPLRGQVLFGAATASPDQDPEGRESTVGGKLGIHRTYWRGDQQAKAVRRAEDDIANGRLPWISFKTPYAPGTSTPMSWERMVAGEGDDWAMDVAEQLGRLPGPVWVAVHHEPEGDGDEQAWKAMQQRLAPFFRAYPNIAFTVILTGWHQFYTTNASLSMDALYPGSSHVDVVGFDPYLYYGTRIPGPGMNTGWLELREYYARISSWASSAGGVKWAIAETGYSDLAAERDVAWLSRAYDDMREYGGIAFTYWDNTSKRGDSWRLDSAAKQAEFARILARSDKLG